MTTTSTSDPLGKFLLKAGYTTEADIENAVAHAEMLRLQKHQNAVSDISLLGEILIAKKILTEHQLRTALFQQLTQEREQYRQHKEMVPAIRIEGVRKTLDEQTVLNAIDLEIPANKVTALIGVSGSGKSVLLKHMIGLMSPDAGTVFIGDQALNNRSKRSLREIRKQFGMLFQASALFDSLNVYENIAFPLRESACFSEQEIQDRVRARLREVNLTGMEHKYPDELSGGMMKRAALARAMVTNPEILLLDEPTAGLDPIIESAIHHLICGTFMRFRYTMVLVSHAVPEIFNWCHHVVVLHQGKILASGPSLEIKYSDHPVIRQFIQGELEGPIRVV